MTNQRLPISVIILTYNEEANIEACLQSVCEWAGEIFVVDSGSTDATQAIAARYGTHIAYHKWKNHADQFNWALDNLPVQQPWMMRLDADETVTPELVAELRHTLPTVPADVNGFYVKRRIFFMGRWIRHGGLYPIWLLRIFRHGKGYCENLWMDEHIVLSEGTTHNLQHDIIDENRKGMRFWTIKHEDYARREMLDLFGVANAEHGDRMEAVWYRGQTQRKRWIKNNLYARSPLFWRAFIYFFIRYIVLLGFLDGKEGLIFHFLQGCWYRFYIDVKIYEARKLAIDPTSHRSAAESANADT
jgi:glycosyltransferase involved in cell wall biosynthesis